MKKLFSLVLVMFFTLASQAQSSPNSSKPDPSKKLQVVDAACGQCRLGLKGKGCDLAVRIDSVAYFVDGTSIDKHGDAHASDGFCNAVRKAEVQGEVVNNRFQSTYFRLIEEQAKKDGKSHH
jgi:hypothetical protein